MGYFCIYVEVMVKVIKSLTLVIFERVSLLWLSIHAKYEVSISCDSKGMIMVKVFFATDRHMDKNRQNKNYMPKFHSDGIKMKHTDVMIARQYWAKHHTL